MRDTGTGVMTQMYVEDVIKSHIKRRRLFSSCITHIHLLSLSGMLRPGGGHCRLSVGRQDQDTFTNPYESGDLCDNIFIRPEEMGLYRM